MIGQVISHYRIVEKLGQGGMGVVYLAEDTRLNRQVALKALSPEFASDPVRRQRFQQEARAAAALSHSGIAAVYALEEIGDALYIVFEYVRGQNLRAVLNSKPLTLYELMELGQQIAVALAAAHVHGIVHRDIKPENIVRTSEGDAKILDFGLARFSPERQQEQETASVRLTDPGTVAGTLVYMSPEQLEGKEADYRSDIFSFGMLLYELATGARPFDGPTMASTITRIITAEPMPLSQRIPDAPAELDRIIRKCLRKKPAERYQSTRDLAVDLQDLRRELESGTRARPAQATESSDFLKQTSIFAGSSPRRWWEIHQIMTALIAAAVIYLGWVARNVSSNDALFIPLVILGAGLISLRVYLIGLGMFSAANLSGEVLGIRKWISAGSLGAIALLLATGYEVWKLARPGLASIFLGVAMGGIVNVFLLEPAIWRSAFPSSSSSAAAQQRKGMLQGGLTARHWWTLNHLFCITGILPVLYAVWLAKEARRDTFGLGLYYTSLAFGAVLGSLRLYQLCVSLFMPGELADEVGRVEPWQRRGDLLFMAVLFVAAASVAGQRVTVAAFLGVIALGGAVTRLLVEPAISRAAFPPTTSQISAPGSAWRGRFSAEHLQIASIQILFLLPVLWFLVAKGEIYESILKQVQAGPGPEGFAPTIVFLLALPVTVLIGVPMAVAIGSGSLEAVRAFRRFFVLFALLELIGAIGSLPLIMQSTSLVGLVFAIAIAVGLISYQFKLAGRILERAKTAKSNESA